MRADSRAEQSLLSAQKTRGRWESPLPRPGAGRATAAGGSLATDRGWAWGLRRAWGHMLWGSRGLQASPGATCCLFLRPPSRLALQVQGPPGSPAPPSAAEKQGKTKIPSLKSWAAPCEDAEVHCRSRRTLAPGWGRKQVAEGLDTGGHPQPSRGRRTAQSSDPRPAEGRRWKATSSSLLCQSSGPPRAASQPRACMPIRHCAARPGRDSPWLGGSCASGRPAHPQCVTFSHVGQPPAVDPRGQWMAS